MANLPYLVVEAMLRGLIEEGTHDSLHTIVRISVDGVLGAGTRANMRAAMTAANKARLTTVYTSGHFGHQFAAASTRAPPAAPPPPPVNTAEFPAICQCIKCFHYLCRTGVIQAGGFRENRISYLTHAGELRDRKGDVPLYIIQRLSQAHLLVLQQRMDGAWHQFSSIFSIVAPFERAMKAYIARVQAFHAAANTPAPINHAANITDTQLSAVDYWIDPTTADDLRAWGLNVATIAPGPARGNMFHLVIKEQNPHRCAMIRWMQTRTGGVARWNNVTPTSLDPTGGTGWYWPPVGVAMYRGDTRAVHTLAAIPGVNFDLLTPVLAAGGLPTVTTGVAATYALTWDAFEAFKIWLSHALPRIEAAGDENPILDILYSVLIHCSAKRMMIGAEPLPAGTLITDHRRSKTRRRKMVLDVALAFIYTLQELAFHTNNIQPDGTLEVIKMYETSWYQNWLSGIQKDQRNPATRLLRDVVPLLGALDRRHQRITRSGRDSAHRS